MSLDVRIPTREEKQRRVIKWILWPLLIFGVAGVVVLAAMVLPRWLGYGETLEKSVVTVKVFKPDPVKAQVILGVGSHKLVAAMPEGGTAMPDGSKDFVLTDVEDVDHFPHFQDRYVEVENAQVQRVIDDYVVAVGTSPQNEIFVVMPASALPSDRKDWGPQVEAKARLSVVGNLRRTPPAEQAKQLFHLKNLNLENVPLPPLYLEATSVKVAQRKPMWGDE